MAVRNTEMSELIEAFRQTETIKGMAARKDLTPLELKEVEEFPSNRTLGMTAFDNMLIGDLVKKYGKDVSHLYRAGLYLISKLPNDDIAKMIADAPKPKRGAPKRKL